MLPSWLWPGFAAEGLVVAVGIEDEVTEQLAGGGVDHADVPIGHEHDDAGCDVLLPEPDVVETTVMAGGETMPLSVNVEAGNPYRSPAARKVLTTMGPVTRSWAVSDIA